MTEQTQIDTSTRDLVANAIRSTLAAHNNDAEAAAIAAMEALDACGCTNLRGTGFFDHDPIMEIALTRSVDEAIRMLKKPKFEMTPDLQELLDATVFIVKANGHEVQYLWEEYSTESRKHGSDMLTLTWVQHEGLTCVIGTLEDRPINLSLTWNRIDGHLVMFWDVISQVNDMAQVEAWLKTYFHGTDDNGMRASTDAGNFWHCQHHLLNLSQNKTNKPN